MFVREKTVTKPRGRTDQPWRGRYYQLVQSYRADGRPRQRVVLHLGHHSTVDEALERWPREIGRLRRTGYADAADELKTKLDHLRKLRSQGTV